MLIIQVAISVRISYEKGKRKRHVYIFVFLKLLLGFLTIDFWGLVTLKVLYLFFVFSMDGTLIFLPTSLACLVNRVTLIDIYIFV